MSRRAFLSVGLMVIVVLAGFNIHPAIYIVSAKAPALAGSPYDLVDAVNALRASFGLAPYSINSILMSTAQAQADFLAATGSMTHSGPGGVGLTERLLAAGYPLAGDLSLGGFRAENITGGDENMPPEAAVDQWTGDAPHLNTMVSQNLTEIGAGVAISNGRVYYVIDAARPSSAGELPSVATSIAGGSPVPDEITPIIIPVSVSTPNAEGNVFHEVRHGQTLWQIAITYEVKIDDIKRLNNLFNNNIYPGSSLLIKQGALVLTGSPAGVTTPILASPSLTMPTATASSIPLTSTAGSVSSSPVNRSTMVMWVVIGITALALVGGGIFTWLGSSKKK